MSEKVIGLSLSGCVNDIINGKVALEDVQFISSGTKCSEPEHWESVIDSYRTYFWRKNPAEGERIARLLISSGLIIQPRLEGRILPSLNLGNDSHWISLSEYNAFAQTQVIADDYRKEHWL